MQLFSRALVAVLTLGAALALAPACSKPVPPKVTPKSINAVVLSSTYVELVATLAVENPNGFDLSAKSVTASFSLEDMPPIGTVNVDTPFTLPAKQSIDMDAPLKIVWRELPNLLPLAQKPSVTYTVDGTVQIGGKLTVSVPFRVKGTLTREQVMSMMVSKLKLLPQ